MKYDNELNEKQKELYLLFRDYNLLSMECDYIRQAMFMLDHTKYPVAVKLSENLNLVLGTMTSLLNEKKVKLENKLDFLV